MNTSKNFGRSPLGSARWVATVVLHRVAVDAAYAARTLDAELEQAGLSERDARLATEIVYGTLRQLAGHRRTARRAPHARSPRSLHAVLRCARATYQALYLSRVPDFAIVQETVSIVKAQARRGAGQARQRRAASYRGGASRRAAGSGAAVVARLDRAAARGRPRSRARCHVLVGRGARAAALAARVARHRPRAVARQAARGAPRRRDLAERADAQRALRAACRRRAQAARLQRGAVRGAGRRRRARRTHCSVRSPASELSTLARAAAARRCSCSTPWGRRGR